MGQETKIFYMKSTRISKYKKENERTPKVQARPQTMQEVASDEVERYDWQGLIEALSALDGETIERDTTAHERDPFK